MGQIAAILRDPVLRMLCFTSILIGVVAASFGPHLSLLGITVFGFSDLGYSVLLVAMLAVSVGVAVTVGVITDQRPSRRPMAIIAAASTALGSGIVWLVPHWTVFVAAHVLIIPLSFTIIGQVFAVMRLYIAQWSPAERDGVTSVIRAAFAVPFVVVLPLWGQLFDVGMPLLTIYPAMVATGLISTWIIWRNWPDDASPPWTENPSGLSFLASVKEVMSGHILWRIVWMGAVHAGSTLMNILLALVFIEAAGRPTGDVGLFFGGFVALEICVMLSVGALAKRFRRLHIIAVGGILYAVFLALLPVLASSTAVWFLMIPVAVGGGLIYGLSISYLQDLLGARPGVGASLPALQRLVSEGLAALIFAVGATLSGYGLAALMGAAMILLGVVMLLFLDRRQ